MSERLELLGTPLCGLHLIEASAGTGKTYAIANLVLRMVLEQGVGIDRILVLTFTTAATEELRERIAARLREARAALAQQPSGEGAGAQPANEILAGIIARVDPKTGELRLAEALSRMDEAAVHTIHAFCQRLLRDNAFETGLSFEPQMIQDESELRRRAAEDLWRREMAAADTEQAAWLLDQWSDGPSGLLKALGGFIGAGEPRLLPDSDGDDDPMAGVRQWRERVADAWPDAREAVLALLRDPGAGLKKNSYSDARIDRIPGAVEKLLARPALPQELPDTFDLLSARKIAKSTKKGCTPPAHPFFDLCGEIDDEVLEAAHRARRARFLRRALTTLRASLRRAKEERRVLYFDDLLSRTAAVLGGPLGPAFAARVRANYPRALIDEFQDTDPLQYHIFRRIYDGWTDPHDGGDPCGLFLIGDPKQAIYAFRGADIFTYMSAKTHAEQHGACWTLDTNWRSARRLVQAVNAVFERARRPFFYDDDIPFQPVQSGPKADDEPLTLDGSTVVPLRLRWLPLESGTTGTPPRLKAADALALAAADCAARVAELLALAASGRALLGGRPLAARDIAVLVRKHDEGTRVREHLSRHGIASVSIGQSSVFDSDEAAELALVLEALADGADAGSIRAALATAMLGWTASRIAALDAEDGGLAGGGEPGGWDALLARFDDYRERWHSRGFLAAFWALMEGEGVAPRLRALPDGERRLTNLLHLAELAQVAAREHPGIEPLLGWLRQRDADPDAEPDAQLLRLESDAALVRIVTLHKSKGLEFPVVMLPFPWTSGRALEKSAPVPFHDDANAPCLDLGSAERDAHAARWAEEDLAESLRLLYVGLTRAKHLCELHWGLVNRCGESAAAYLLHPDPDQDGPGDRIRKRDSETLRAELDGLIALAPDAIEIVDAAARPPGRRDPAAAGADALSARPFTGRIPAGWRLTSYSGLVGGHERDRPDRDAEAPAAASSPEPVPMPADGPEPVRPAEIDPVFRLPRGIRAGHCLHAMLEHLDFAAADDGVLGEVAGRALARHGLDPVWAEAARLLLQRVLDTPLATHDEGARGPLRLRGLGQADRLNELEFHFSLGGTEPARLAALLRAHGYPDAGLAGEGGPLLGLMKGYVDLVFRAGGRYYIADYKSNHLGDRIEDYARGALGAAMTAHGYRLQYLIYCVALHRYLRRRLADYDYERYFGGVYYLFLRGMRPEQGPACGVYHDRPSPALIEALDAVLAGRREGP